MNRWAVQRATKRDVVSVSRCRDMALGIQEQLLIFDFRNGDLRCKYDSLKYTFHNLGRLLYDPALSPRDPPPPPAEPGEADQARSPPIFSNDGGGKRLKAALC